MRDNGAIWVEKTNVQGAKSLGVQDCGFDGWGGDGGPSRKDDAVPQYVAKIEGVGYEKVDIVLEKGTLEFNGKDTLLTSWTVLHDRNPRLSQAQLESVLKERFGVSKVVWVSGSAADDLTDGHIDGIARFVNEHTVVVGRYANQRDPGAALYERAAAVIKAAGLNVVRLDIPGNVTYRGESLQANYLNYLVANGVVVASSYGNAKFDNAARLQLQQLFPGRHVVMTDTRELWYNGGAVHCVTNDQPLLVTTKHAAASQVVASSQASPPAAIVVTSTATPTAAPLQTLRGDVNRDGKVSSLDALAIVNALYWQAHLIPGGRLQAHEAVFARYESLDVNDDDVLSALDALMIVNQLRR